jgi:hypothetical protein
MGYQGVQGGAYLCRPAAYLFQGEQMAHVVHIVAVMGQRGHHKSVLCQHFGASMMRKAGARRIMGNHDKREASGKLLGVARGFDRPRPVVQIAGSAPGGIPDRQIRPSFAVRLP